MGVEDNGTGALGGGEGGYRDNGAGMGTVGQVWGAGDIGKPHGGDMEGGWDMGRWGEGRVWGPTSTPAPPPALGSVPVLLPPPQCPPLLVAVSS